MLRDLSLVVICIILVMATLNAIKNKDKIRAGGYNKYSPDFVVVGGGDEYKNDQKKWEIENELYQTQQKVNEVSKEIQKQNDDKILSKYRNQVTLSGGYGSSADTEYLTIQANSNNQERIKITGWTLTSTTTNNTINIPKSTTLYFSNSINSEEDIYLYPGETAYIITGKSPIGYGFKTNKCSGYLTQYNSFTPYLYTNCPHPSKEDLSSIPNRVSNEECFDLINSYPTCRIQETPLSNKYTSECQDFIYKKINYPNCINVHKNDKDFWGKEYRIYLKRNDKLWRNGRETIIIYDEFNKPVGKIFK